MVRCVTFSPSFAWLAAGGPDGARVAKSEIAPSPSPSPSLGARCRHPSISRALSRPKHQAGQRPTRPRPAYLVGQAWTRRLIVTRPSSVPAE
ncbi:hypothetical protein CALCODRAFT_499337 [Calocera cornea HHB12733]|uniref:Uncharacterized protein n=1 Tax=Calocera cornea HHB12733 TaxID=1353952 RepID=A0A165EGJ0_9BASI|nr:hypothetical protein CALCODRAFT_499337 [Calocera cornea HHB12733]